MPARAGLDPELVSEAEVWAKLELIHPARAALSLTQVDQLWLEDVELV